MNDRRIYETLEWGPFKRIFSHPVQKGATAYILSRTGMKEIINWFFVQEEAQDHNPRSLSKIRFLPKDRNGNIAHIDKYLDSIDRNFLVLPSLFTVDAFDKPATIMDWVESERFSNHAHISATLDLVHQLAGEREKIVL